MASNAAAMMHLEDAVAGRDWPELLEVEERLNFIAPDHLGIS